MLILDVRIILDELKLNVRNDSVLDPSFKIEQGDLKNFFDWSESS